MHREPLCGGSGVGSEGRAGSGCTVPESSGLGIWGRSGLWGLAPAFGGDRVEQVMVKGDSSWA